MSTRRQSESMFNAVQYGNDNNNDDMEVKGEAKARGPGRRPGLQIDTVAASDRTRRIPEALRTGSLARDPSSHELDNRGWYDDDTDGRAAAPWASKEAFTPVGLKGAFTPASMLSPIEYFPKMEEDVVAPLPSTNSYGHRNTGHSSTRSSPERRPVGRGRLQSAPAYLADRRHIPQVSRPTTRDAHAATKATTNSSNNRRQTLPVTPARRPVPPPTSASYASPRVPLPHPQPELLHPQPQAPNRRSNRSSASGSSIKQSAGLALVKGVNRVKSFAHRAAQIGGSISRSSSRNRSRSRNQKRKESTYLEPPSLAENALSQGEYVRYAADFASNIIEGREVGNFSPTSCDRLWRATSDSVPSEEKERAARVFAARQQVHHMPEARAQAALSQREMERARAAASTGNTGPSRPGHGRRSRVVNPQERQERYRMQAESNHEEQARRYIAEQKDQAEVLALECPDRFPGLRKR